MKNLVEPIKLTEPVKPVQNQSLSVNQQKPQQQGEQASGQNDFQAMLDKQVQERRMQDKKLDANKQQGKTAEKPQENKSAKTEANAKQSAQGLISTETETNAETAEVNTKLAFVDSKQTTTKQAAGTNDKKLAVKADAKVVNDNPKTDLAAKTVEVEAKTNQPKQELNSELKNTQQHQGVKHTKKMHRMQLEKTPTQEVSDTHPTAEAVKHDAVALGSKTPKHVSKPLDQSVDSDAKLSESEKPENVQVKGLPNDAQVTIAQTTQSTVDNRAATVEAEHEEMPDHHLLNQAPGAKKLIKSAEKQLNQVNHQANDQKIAKAEAVASETGDKDLSMLEQQAATAGIVEAEHAPKHGNHSAIAELQKTALEKRHQAKQLQKDMSLGQLRSAMVKEGMSEDTGLEAAMMPRSELAADFLQTMTMQAATVKPAAQRATPAEAFKTDELKAATSKATETPTPLASTQPAVGANAGLQASSVMAAAPMGSSNQIYAYPGKAGWNQAISQKVMYMVGASEQTARLSLNPPELGPLQVVIEVNDEKADTTFISDNEEVRQALEDGMDYLREKMDEAGISLGQANVNDGQRFNQSQQEGFASNFKQNGGNQTAAETVIEETVTTAKVQSTNNGLVDTFA